mgnify:CR=1 FL=1
MCIRDSYLTGVEARYEALRAGHSPHREWAARLVTLGQPVTVNAPDGVYQGVAEDVDEAGALRLCQTDGQVVRILAGDVSLRESGKANDEHRRNQKPD